MREDRRTSRAWNAVFGDPADVITGWVNNAGELMASRRRWVMIFESFGSWERAMIASSGYLNFAKKFCQVCGVEFLVEVI